MSHCLIRLSHYEEVDDPLQRVVASVNHMVVRAHDGVTVNA